MPEPDEATRGVGWHRKLREVSSLGPPKCYHLALEGV